MEEQENAKPPYFMNFVVNLPDYVSFSKEEYDDPRKRGRQIRQIINITRSINQYMDKLVRETIDTKEIDAIIEKKPRIQSEDEYHKLVDYYNQPQLKEVVNSLTGGKSPDNEELQSRELLWVYIARRIFHDVFLRTDYDLPDINELSHSDEYETKPLPDFNRSLKLQ